MARTDCRSPIGETVAMIDAALILLRKAGHNVTIMRPKAQDCTPIAEAIADMAGDPAIDLLLASTGFQMVQMR